MQAPLLAYNHFVEALFVLNDCRAGLCACAAVGGSAHDGPPAASQADAGGEALSQVVGAPGGPGSLAGPSPQAREKRDAIYKCAARAKQVPVHDIACRATLHAQSLMRQTCLARAPRATERKGAHARCSGCYKRALQRAER